MPPPDKGADQLVWLATTTPGTGWQPGSYDEKRKLAKSPAEAHDDDLARRLWDDRDIVVGHGSS